MTYDVVVVGGGPIGAVAARVAAENGARTLLVEKGDGSGEPARCAGLVSPRVLPTLGASDDSIIREIRGVLIHSPSSRELSLRSEEVKAFVLDRPALDRELLAIARGAGVEVLLRARLTSAHPGSITLILGEAEEEVRTGVIIGADGPASIVASSFSLPSPEEVLMASQATVEGDARREDEVDIYFGRSVAPTFFAWAIPAQEGKMRVGLAAPVGTNTDRLLSNFLLEQKLGTEVDRVHGLIPVSLVHNSIADGALLVGDAAGQVKPSSGGGLYTGGVCARIAGRVAAEAALARRTKKTDLAPYEELFMRKIGGEIGFARAARSLLRDVDDAGIDALLAGIDRPQVRELISSYGDIDYPSRIAHALASRRDLWATLRPLIPILGGASGLSEMAHMILAGHDRGHV